MEQDVIDKAFAEVRAILSKMMEWNVKGFTEMPIKQVEDHRSIFGPVTLDELLVKETLMGHGFHVFHKNFRGKRSLFVSWKKDEEQRQLKTFFERGTPILP